MTSYTVRIELHNADEDDYSSLHEAMEGKGFVRWIAGRNGSRSRLPTAEYNLADTTLDRSEVLDRARTTANSVKPQPTPWIYVTQSAGRTWSGLDPWEE